MKLQNLGALELNAAVVLNDVALERAATSANPMTANHHPLCHHIDDGALEEAGLEMQPKPKTIIFPGQRGCL